MTAPAAPDDSGAGRAPDPDHARLVTRLAEDVTHEIGNHLPGDLGNAGLLGSAAGIPESARGQPA